MKLVSQHLMQSKKPIKQHVILPQLRDHYIVKTSQLNLMHHRLFCECSFILHIDNVTATDMPRVQFALMMTDPKWQLHTTSVRPPDLTD